MVVIIKKFTIRNYSKVHKLTYLSMYEIRFSDHKIFNYSNYSKLCKLTYLLMYIPVQGTILRITLYAHK